MKYPLHVRDLRHSDPFILADPMTKKYYTYAVNFNLDRFPDQKVGGAFHAIISGDLVHWSEPVEVFCQNDFWADLDYWAPECHIWKGKYYIFSSFRTKGKYRACQCLVADNPLGPFTPVRDTPATPEGWQCLDATLYVDQKGNPWMVFCHEWVQVYDGQMAAIPLSDDLGEAIGDPVILFRGSDAPWQKSFSNDQVPINYVTDGCFLHRCQNGDLLMLWSSFSDTGYTTGYAKSISREIYGPWEQIEKPIYALDGGHSMLFNTFDGRLIMPLHSPNDNYNKRMLLFEMEETEGELAIINEITGNWYTRSGVSPVNTYRYEDACIEESCFTKICMPDDYKKTMEAKEEDTNH